MSTSISRFVSSGSRKTCLRASERIRDEPRFGLELIEHLSTTVQQLEKIAGSAQAKEEAMRQAMSWRVASEDLLPNE